MLTQFRHIAFALAALGAFWAGAAMAQWPFGPVVKLEPGYGGVCEACDLSGRIMAGARMRNSIFNRSDFSGAVLARADASGSSFEGADFTAADVSHARLMDARCARAVFDRAHLRHADARRADFTDARFDGADLSGADLRGASGLTQAQLSTACGDAHTRLPEGLRVAACRGLN